MVILERILRDRGVDPKFWRDFRWLADRPELVERIANCDNYREALNDIRAQLQSKSEVSARQQHLAEGGPERIYEGSQHFG